VGTLIRWWRTHLFYFFSVLAYNTRTPATPLPPALLAYSSPQLQEINRHKGCTGRCSHSRNK